MREAVPECGKFPTSFTTFPVGNWNPRLERGVLESQSCSSYHLTSVLIISHGRSSPVISQTRPSARFVDAIFAVTGCQVVNATQKRGQKGSCTTPSESKFPNLIRVGPSGALPSRVSS